MAGAGEVEIKLDGKSFVLKSSLRAGYAIADMGGAATVWQRLANMDLRVYVAVIAAGLGKLPASVEDVVFATGMAPLTEPLSLFVGYLSNGGKAVKIDEGGDLGEA